jgi:tetratricopeptide (TPR) repeat protein
MGRQEQAREQYEKIMAQPDHTDSDLLNYGYCLWIAGEIPGAVKLFRSFLDSNPETSLYDEFQRDNYLLADNHISSTDQALVIDLVVG